MSDPVSEARLKSIETRLDQLEMKTSAHLSMIIKFHPEILEGFNDWLKEQDKDPVDADELLRSY